MKTKQLELRTFQDWSNAGYKILKGSKHVKRNANGIPLFSNEQVTYTRTSYHGQGEEGDESFGCDFDPDLPGNPDDFGCKD